MGCGLSTSATPSQQDKSGVSSAIMLLTAINSDLFCSNRIIMTYYLIRVMLIFQRHLQWEIKLEGGCGSTVNGCPCGP